jgi:hypothetical protein
MAGSALHSQGNSGAPVEQPPASATVASPTQTTKDGASWSPVVATGSVGSQIEFARKRQKQAKTVAEGHERRPVGRI